MKKLLALCLTVLLCLGSMTVAATAEAPVEITFMSYLEQYQDQMDKLCELYKTVNPNVTIKVETIGADYDKILQTRITTEEVPDIFLSGPFTYNEMYAPASMDLSGQSFLSDINMGPEFRLADGTYSAIPFTSQVWGILYNQDVFAAAGITEKPKTLTELTAVCEKLIAAGYIPFAQGYKSSYVKNQFFGFTYAVDPNYAENIAKLTAKEAKLTDFDFIQKIFDTAEIVGRKYTQQDPFNDDFASAASRLGLGEAGMMICGDWIVANAQKANPDAKIGMMALPMSEDPADAKVYSCDSIGLHISKTTKHPEEALAFVNWLVTSQEGKDWISKDLKALSAIKGVSPEGAIALNESLEYISAGQSGNWASYLFPNGIGTDQSEVYDRYLLGEMSRDEAIEALTTIWSEFEA